MRFKGQGRYKFPGIVREELLPVHEDNRKGVEVCVCVLCARAHAHARLNFRVSQPLGCSKESFKKGIPKR